MRLGLPNASIAPMPARFLLIIAASLLASSAAADAIVAFDTHGGDAWTYSLQVAGRFERGQCESIVIDSGTARIAALRLEDRFYAEVPLVPGHNALRALCGKAGRTVATSVPQIWRTALPDLPKARIRLLTEANAIHLDANASERAASLAAPLRSFEWRARPGNPSALRTTDGAALMSTAALSADRLALAIPDRDGEYYVELRVMDELGRASESAHVFRIQNGRAHAVDLDSEHPSWVDAAVLYGAAPYMFEPQGFRGIELRLDAIAALGATAIWISPVTAAAPDDFGYAVVDQFSIREDFGGAAGLRSLIEAAHRRGLRVLVDFVPNHFSQFHAYFVDAERHGAQSPYYDWFDRDASGKVTQYFDWQHLKNLNFDHPGVRGHITAAAARFVQTFGIDGFRVDASWAVAQRAPEFWPEMRRELKRIDPDIVLIAEASARESYHVSNGFDAAYDWTEALGQWAWHDVFRADHVDLDRLRSALTNDGRGFPSDSLVLRFINNNDTGERFITRFGRETARLAATLLFTLPGIPLIYNGDEVGAAFQPYDEGPPIEWQTSSLTEHYRQLAKLRREVDALRTRDLLLLATTRPATTLAYQRPGAQGAPAVIVLLNFANVEREISPDDAIARAAFSRMPEATDALTGETIHISKTRPSVQVPARSARVLLAPSARPH